MSSTAPQLASGARLPDDPVLLQQMILELRGALEAQRRKLEQVQHRLHLILQRLYGPRQERINPEQLLLFAEMLSQVQADVAPAKEEAASAAASVPQRRGHGRRQLPEDLPTIPVLHDLTEAEKACPDCGQPRQRIGEQKSRQLDYQPASLFVIEHIQPTYVCSRCHAHAQTVAKPAQPIAKGLPGPGLLAHVITSKYADHLPLYRQERILERFGVHLSRSTLCDWMAQAAVLLRPVYTHMIKRVLQSRVLHTDDTPVPVQEPRQERTKTGRIWVYLGDEAHPYNVFDYSPDHRRQHPATFLQSFQGYLQADAFAGYDGIYLSQPVIEVACNAHARRKFFEAKQSDPARGHQALAFYRQLYDLERQASDHADKEYARRQHREPVRRQDLREAERLRLRQEQSVPLLTSMCHWLKEQQAEVLPKSPIGQAIAYALNHWAALTRYTEQGFLTIDNNWAEREMKKTALGRKNWLFFGSDQGGRTAAVLLSLVSSGQRHGLDPFRYLEDVLYRLPGLKASQLAELLPDRWQAPHRAGPAPPLPPKPAGDRCEEVGGPSRPGP